MTALNAWDIFAFLRRHVTVPRSVTSKRFAVVGDSVGSYRQIFVKSHISTEKISPAEDGNASEKLFVIVVGDFLPRLSELWPLNMSLLVSKSFLFFFIFLLWLGISQWGQRIPHENCLYSILKVTAVYRTIKQPSLRGALVTVLLLAMLKNHHAQPHNVLLIPARSSHV